MRIIRNKSVEVYDGELATSTSYMASAGRYRIHATPLVSPVLVSRPLSLPLPFFGPRPCGSGGALILRSLLRLSEAQEGDPSRSSRLRQRLLYSIEMDLQIFIARFTRIGLRNFIVQVGERLGR